MEKVPISSYPYNSEDLSGHVSRSTTLLMFMINSEGLNRFEKKKKEEKRKKKRKNDAVSKKRKKKKKEKRRKKELILIVNASH